MSIELFIDRLVQILEHTITGLKIALISVAVMLIVWAIIHVVDRRCSR